MLKTKRLSAKLTETPALGEHFVIELSNERVKKPFKRGKPASGVIHQVFDVDGDTVKIRLSKETALLLSDFIDNSLEF